MTPDPTGGQGLATAYYLAKKYAINNVAVLEKGWLDGGMALKAAEQKPCGAAEAAKIYPAVVDLMWERGYTDEDIKKVLGGNLMRVYKKVWG